MAKIFVCPAKQGLLVAFTPHRPGRFMGARRALAHETPDHQVPGGHGYMTDGVEEVERTSEIQRRLQHKDLVEVSESRARAMIEAQRIAMTPPAEPESDDDVEAPAITGEGAAA